MLNKLYLCRIKKYFDDFCLLLDYINTKFEVIILTEAGLGLAHISINNFQVN